MNIRHLIYPILFIINIHAYTQQETLEIAYEGPKVGLVLSGGGAKGFAYIGLLKVLEEVNMPIDYIGGSSIGAIIAGLYSVGYSPETIEEIIRKQDWAKLISDRNERKYFAYEEKLFGDKFIFSMPIKGKGFSLSNSISSSFNVDLMLSNLFSPVAHINDFSKLPIPFICIGTDLLTGDAVVLDSGNIDRAIRASMAIPGYFSPINYQNHYMIDGGVVNNYPAEQVKNMGADFILGGDVQSGLKTDIEELSSVTGILDQVISFHRVNANNKGFELTDYYVRFKMPYGMMDFTEYDSIIAFGEKIAKEHYSQLKSLADSINKIRNFVKHKSEIKPSDLIKINKISWPDMNRQQKERFTGYLEGIDTGKTSFAKIEEKMKLLNGTNSFDELRYQLISKNPQSANLEIYTEGLNKGSMAAGIHYDNDYQGSILVNFSLRNLNGGPSKLFTDIVLGQNPRLNSMFIINNGFRPGFGAEVDLFSFDFPEYDSSKKVNSWKFDNISAGIFMPMIIKTDFLFKLGLKYELFRFKQEVVLDNELDAYNTFSDYGNIYTSFNLDTRDKVSFTQSGSHLEFKIKYIFPFSEKWNDFISNASISYLKYNYNLPLSKKLVFKPGIFLGYTYLKETSTQLPDSNGFKRKIPAIQHLFGFGGQNPNNYIESNVPFAGLRFNESFGLYCAQISTKLQYNFYDQFYATLLADIGFSEIDKSNINGENIILGYGIKLSYNSFIGPVELSLMGSNINTSSTFYTNIGFWF